MPSDDRTRILTPQDIQNAHTDERKKKRVREDQDELADRFAEQIALDNNPDADYSTRGKAIQRHGSRKGGAHSHKASNIFCALSGAVGAGLSLKTVQQMYLAFVHGDLSASFTEKAKIDKISAHLYEDKNYSYETASVSSKTHTVLDKETAIIEEKLRELQSIKDARQREAFALKITELAEDFQMRCHPLTARYVHDIARVEREEHIHNPHGKMECTGTVCVFRVKAEIGDLRGVKQQIGDVYNKDVAEIIATGDHLKGPSAPAPH